VSFEQGRREPREVGDVTSARVLYRDYLIDLKQDDKGWRVTSIAHSLNKWIVRPPVFHYPDQTTAERYAKAAIDEQLTGDRRGR
jgi:hypothetical protein